MTIETILERIATAGERQAVAMEAMVRLNLEAATQILQTGATASAAPGVEPGLDGTPSYVEQRKAEVKAEPEKEKRKPGRPKKEDAKPVEDKKPEPGVEADPFADEPIVETKAREITKEELRKVMVDLRNKVGKDKAYALLREHGNGATFLPGSTASGAAAGAGELKPEYFLAVVYAAEALLG